MPAVLAPGEHVLTVEDVARLGGQPGVYALRNRLKGQGAQAFANGGAVQYAPTIAPQAMSFGDLNPSFSVTVQSKGGIDLTKYIDVSIARADQQGQLSNRMGRQVR